MPADITSAALVIQHEVTNTRRDVFPLPVAFAGPRYLRQRCGSRSGGGPDRVGRGPEIMGRHMSHRHRLPGGQRRELHRIGKATARSVRRERCTTAVCHPHLAPNPRTTQVDGLAGPGVAGPILLEERQHMLCAKRCPSPEQPVVLIGQGPTAANRDQPWVTFLRQDRHDPILPPRPDTQATQTRRSTVARSARPAALACEQRLGVQCGNWVRSRLRCYLEPHRLRWTIGGQPD